VYGIGVVKKEDKLNPEEAVVRNFSCCIESTRKVLSKLANNVVLPVELKYILEDIITA